MLRPIELPSPDPIEEADDREDAKRSPDLVLAEIEIGDSAQGSPANGKRASCAAMGKGEQASEGRCRVAVAEFLQGALQALADY